MRHKKVGLSENMERNYVILMGLFLLLVAVDCSSSDPIQEGKNVKENIGLDQNVVGTGDGVKENVATKSNSDSVGVDGVKGNGGDIIKGSQGGSQSHTSKNNSNQRSSSTEGENSKKDEKVSAEGKGKTDAENKGDHEHRSREEPKTEEEKISGKKEGDGARKSQEEPKSEEEKISGKKEGDGAHKSQEESIVSDNGKINGETSSDTGNRGQEESIGGVKGKTGGGKDGDTLRKSQEESNIKGEGKTDGHNKENPGETVDLKEVIKEKGNAEESIPPPPPAARTDGIRGEECDPSNMCMDKNKRFAACLRVPGNESPDLSLLIQNKGDMPLALEISAPDFVQLEKTKVEVKEKQDRKVKVSIRSSGKENLIVLKDVSGECILDFKDFITHNSAKTYVNFLSQTPTTAFIFVAAILILASGWVCMSSRRKKLTRSGFKYLRMNMDLPVTVVEAKPEPNVNNDGWDNSWGDNWDDEEAPVTPSKPVTPSLSSKGLASRRLSKEGWKD